MLNQIELFEIESPCVGVCQSNKRGYCFGCLRSREERQLWLKMTNEQRREVIRLIAGRRKRIEQLKRKKQEQMELDFGDNAQMGQLFE